MFYTIQYLHKARVVDCPLHQWPWQSHGCFNLFAVTDPHGQTTLLTVTTSHWPAQHCWRRTSTYLQWSTTFSSSLPTSQSTNSRCKCMFYVYGEPALTVLSRSSDSNHEEWVVTTCATIIQETSSPRQNLRLLRYRRRPLRVGGKA